MSTGVSRASAISRTGVGASLGSESRCAQRQRRLARLCCLLWTFETDAMQGSGGAVATLRPLRIGENAAVGGGRFAVAARCLMPLVMHGCAGRSCPTLQSARWREVWTRQRPAGITVVAEDNRGLHRSRATRPVVCFDWSCVETAVSADTGLTISRRAFQRCAAAEGGLRRLGRRHGSVALPARRNLVDVCESPLRHLASGRGGLRCTGSTSRETSGRRAMSRDRHLASSRGSLG